MPRPYFKDIFEYPIEQFLQHLELPDNNKIIFSGRYGIGKTQFLDDFFTRENQQILFADEEAYVTYCLSPVNYSISATQDIVNYLKYDVILEFLRNGYTFEESELDFLGTLPFFLREHLLDVLTTMINMIPEVGHEVVDSYKKIQELKKLFKKYQVKTNRKKSDLLVEHLDSIEKDSTSIYANDIVTKLIAEVIAKRGKESILIIDDIDRLDPEHIFRILNVFSAHLGSNPSKGGNNKFGFTKIILVCDFENIRQLFHHRYGAEADFSGYIDKFYSLDVYHFDNAEAITKVVEAILNSLQFNVPAYSAQAAKDLVLANNLLRYTSTLFIRSGLINLRSLLKFHQRSIDLLQDNLQPGNTAGGIKAGQFPVCMQLKLLSLLFGNVATLLKAVQLCEQRMHSPGAITDCFGDLLLLIAYSQNEFLTNRSRDVFECTINNIHYAVKAEIDSRTILVKTQVFEWKGNTTTSLNGRAITVNPQECWSALHKAVEKLQQAGYLK